MIITGTPGVAFHNGTFSIEVKDPIYGGAYTVSCYTGESVSFAVVFKNRTSSTVYSATNLPDGLSINSSTGIVSGIVTSPPDTFFSEIICTNARKAVRAGVTFAVGQPVGVVPVINSALTATGQETVAGFSYTITAQYTSSLYDPVAYTATGLPSGLSVSSSTGVISGTPAAATAGAHNVTIGCTNVNGAATTKTLVITIAAAPAAIPVITSALTASGQDGASFSYSITATNTPTSYSISNDQQLALMGLSLNTGTGAITGTLDIGAGSSDTFEIRATNAAGTGRANWTLTITAVPTPPVINSPLTLTVAEDTNFSYSITATNSPTSYGATIPGSLGSVTRSGNVLSGSEETPGTYNIPISATNADGTDNETLVLTVTNVVTLPVITSASTASGTQFDDFEYQITATNTSTSYSVTNFAMFSAVGLSLNTSTGLISGTPTGAVSGACTIQATNEDGSGTAQLTITIASATDWKYKSANEATVVAPMALTGGSYVSSPTANSGTATLTFTVPSGENGWYYATVSGYAPPMANSFRSNFNSDPSGSDNYAWGIFTAGSQVDTIIRYGAAVGPSLWTPTVWNLSVGDNDFITQAREANVRMYSVTLTKLNAPSAITPSSTAGSEGVQMNVQMSAANYPTSWSASGLPAGVTINTTTGVVSGAPTSSGTTNATITATNATGSTNANLQLVIAGPPTVPAAPTIGTATVINSTTVSVTYTANSDGGAAVSAFIATSSPGGVTGAAYQSTDGTILVYGLTPSTAYNFTVKAQNQVGLSAASAATSPDVTTDAPDASMIPAARLFAWSANVNVGVPGGIPTGRTLSSTIDAGTYGNGTTDARAAIQAAITAANAGTYVFLPDGTYRITGSLIPKANVTLRGNGWTTIIKPDSGNNFAIVHENNTTSSVESPQTVAGWESSGTLITAGGTQGSTSITVDSAAGFAIGDIGIITDANDYTVPVMDVNGKRQRRGQMSRITGIAGNVLTIAPPIAWSPYSNLRIVEMTGRTEGVGVEDLQIDLSSDISSGGQTGAYFWQCEKSWFKNVKVTGTSNYGLWFQRCFECEIRHCHITPRKGGGTNGSGILVQFSTACLFEDNIIDNCLPHFEVNFQCTANVFAYNLCYNADFIIPGANRIGQAIGSNHGGHNQFNLYEGNVASNIQSDGYFGSASEDTVFRNWLHGKSVLADELPIAVRLNRFTRKYNVVGNILGNPDAITNGYEWIYDNSSVQPTNYYTKMIYWLGGPFVGGGGSSGTASLLQGDPWANWPPTTSMNTDSYPELDLDVAATTIRRGNYNYATDNIPATEAIAGADYPDSLFRVSAPSWFNSLTWPPFDAETPGTPSDQRIPAGYRYWNGGAEPP